LLSNQTLSIQIFKNPLKIPQKFPRKKKRTKNKELGDGLKRVVLSQRGEEIGVVSIGESERRWLIVAGGEVAAPNHAVSVCHSHVVFYTPFLREPLDAENSLDRGGVTMVDVEPELQPDPVTAPATEI
jgi:hypothetical protein